MYVFRLFGLLLIAIILTCSSSTKLDGDKKFIEDKRTFVSYFSLNVSSHLSTYSELSVIEAVQNLSRFKDIENAWIVDVNNRLITVMKGEGYRIGKPFQERWLLSVIDRAKKARGTMVVIKKGKGGMIYSFVSPLFDRVFGRYLGVAIVQYIKKVKNVK